MSQEFPFAPVTASVREDKVVAEIDRVSRPSNKMVDYSGPGDRPLAVMAYPLLMIPKHPRERGESSSFAAKQKCREIGIAKHATVRSYTSNLSHPGAANCIEDKAVQATKGDCYTWTQPDPIVLELGPSIQEFVSLTADRLELPQRHNKNDSAYPVYQGRPFIRPAGNAQCRMLRVLLDQSGYYGCLFAGVL